MSRWLMNNGRKMEGNTSLNLMVKRGYYKE